jgi:hypothetical protein
MPLMICVPASLRAWPSDLPFTMKAMPVSFEIATLLSIPSASQATERRRPVIQLWISLAVHPTTPARPAPTALWRHGAVGPVAHTSRSATAAAAAGSPAARAPARGPAASAASPSAARSTTTARQAPGAVSSGRTPKPPATAPAIAPAVLNA